MISILNKDFYQSALKGEGGTECTKSMLRLWIYSGFFEGMSTLKRTFLYPLLLSFFSKSRDVQRRILFFCSYQHSLFPILRLSFLEPFIFCNILSQRTNPILLFLVIPTTYLASFIASCPVVIQVWTQPPWRTFNIGIEITFQAINAASQLDLWFSIHHLANLRNDHSIVTDGKVVQSLNLLVFAFLRFHFLKHYEILLSLRTKL